MSRLLVHIISSRTPALRPCVESLLRCYDAKAHPLDIVVFHFDRIYSAEFAEQMRREVYPNIRFVELVYGRPSKMPFDNIYFVRKQTPTRIGYHAMCQFMANYYDYPGARDIYSQYDLAWNTDDDALWRGKFDHAHIETFVASDAVILSFNCYRYDKDHRSREVRTGLCELVKRYCSQHQLVPAKPWLRDVVAEQDLSKARDLFQVGLVCYDTNITKLRIFRTEEHRRWTRMVNEALGIWEWRWGDNEILSLFHDLHFETEVMMVGAVKGYAGAPETYMDPGGLRHTTGFAPGVARPKNILDL